MNLISKKEFLEHGFIIQKANNTYVLGQGPFTQGGYPYPLSVYRPDFFLEHKQPWFYPRKLFILNRKQMYDFLFEKKTENKMFQKDLIKNFFSHSQKPNFISYQQCFIQAKKALCENKFQKIVPTFSEVFLKKIPLLDFLQRLFLKTRFLKGFLYGFWDKQSGFLGFTPEFLFHLNQKSFSTMALAGTDLKNSPSLLKDKKQLKEHNFVVKDLKEKLSDFVFLKTPQKTSEIVFPPLKHLKTDLKGILKKSLDFEKICKILHPTSAVGGYPKKRALDWLKQHKSQKARGFFSIPFGFFESSQKAFCLVALRNLQWNQKEISIFSGSGWIVESCLQKEWHELNLKRKQVKFFFGFS
ncbi:MAG: chorismate-binding protein [Bdellovibrionales bacterium]|nr:chorismate-binding protein [Bdellovibrionales bacterium]